MVKEDKCLKNFIDHGAKELEPLREFRNWLIELRANPDARDYRRRNGSVYVLANGQFGRGPFTMSTRQEILQRLLELEVQTGFELITEAELKCIDKMWCDDGDLTRRALVDIYRSVKGRSLPWDQFKQAKYSVEDLSLIKSLCDKHEVPFDLMSKLMITVDNTKLLTRTAVTMKNVDRVLNEGWLHFDSIQQGLENENSEN